MSRSPPHRPVRRGRGRDFRRRRGLELFDTIILLTGPGEQAVLGSALLNHNPALVVRWVTTSEQLLAVEPEILPRARLVAFASPVIVPAAILERLAYGAYNFHPGPPDYPGLSPAQFAIYRGATRFGATFHMMSPRVDEGPIVGFLLFDVPSGITVPELEICSYRELARLFWQFAGPLAIQAEPLSTVPVRWSGEKSSRRRYAALCDISPDISRDELERRIAAFGGNYFGIAPTVTLHGFRFQLVQGQPLQAPAEPAIPQLTSKAS